MRHVKSLAAICVFSALLVATVLTATGCEGDPTARPLDPSVWVEPVRYPVVSSDTMTYVVSWMNLPSGIHLIYVQLEGQGWTSPLTIISVEVGSGGGSVPRVYGHRMLAAGAGSRAIPLPPRLYTIRTYSFAEPNINGREFSTQIVANDWDSDADDISDAVEDENNGVTGMQTPIIDESGNTHYGWYVRTDQNLPPPISTSISSSNVLYPNRGTHDYSLARGTVSNGTLYNGLRYGDAGTGYYDKNQNDICWRDMGKYGTLELVNYLEKVARAWNQLHPYPPGPRIGLGDASLQYGGDYWDCHGNHHDQHQNGLEVDLRYVRNDNIESPVTISSTAYDRPRTQQLVNLFLGLATGAGVTILSSDDQLQGVWVVGGHTDHLHIWIADPDGTNN